LVKFAVLQWFFAPQGTEKYAMGALSLAECVKRVVMGASNFKFGQNCHISSRRGNGIYRLKVKFDVKVCYRVMVVCQISLHSVKGACIAILLVLQ